MREVFEKHKSPGARGIPESNLSSALRDLGTYTDADGIKELSDTYDLNSDGLFDLAEFAQVLTRPSKVEQWAISLPLAQLLADCMLSRENNQVSPDVDPLRALSSLSSNDIEVSTQYFHEGLSRLLSEEVDKLKQAYAEMDQKFATASESHASSKFALVGMSCGDITNFRGGLNERVGDPSLDFLKAMETEHCHRKVFKTQNYGIETCPFNEWDIVVNRNLPAADMRSERRVPDIDELLKLEQAIAAKLTREEVVAVVLYTGPMFEIYNCVLRQFPKSLYEELRGEGNPFTTTIHVLVSAVQKLASVAKVPDGLKLYRGLGAVSDLPSHFFKQHENGGKGITEWGFMSTTSDKNIAIFYTQQGYKTRATLPIVLEITAGAVDRGACIMEFSQYQQEVEYLWVPCSFVAPSGLERMEIVRDKEGGVRVIRIICVEVNRNVTALTLDEMKAYKKKTHIAAFRYLLQELKRDLDQICQEMCAAMRLESERFQSDGHKRFYTVGRLVEQILYQGKRRLETHGRTSSDAFAKDETFRRMVTEMLDTKTMAKSKLKLWLRDHSQSIKAICNMTLKDAHRHYLSFLRRRLLGNNEAKRETALEICKLKGLVENSVDERDEDDSDTGETKLSSASADGVGADDLELLLEAGGLVGETSKMGLLSEALIGSACFGHMHCVRVLMSANADILFRDEVSTLLCFVLIYQVLSNPFIH